MACPRDACSMTSKWLRGPRLSFTRSANDLKKGLLHHLICLLLITLLLSCCKHPVKILIKSTCKYSSSCNGMPPGFLQNDRRVVARSQAFNHSICLLLISLLLSYCEDSTEITGYWSLSSYTTVTLCTSPSRANFLTCFILCIIFTKVKTGGKLSSLFLNTELLR